MDVINKDYKLIPVGQLRPHPHNPNRGDLAAIQESVDVNGFYGAVTVREHPSGEPDVYEILAGEHRWKTAVKAGSPDVPCIVVEANDVTAARVLLGDNEIAKRSTYDPDQLTHVLRELGSVEGTGFDLAPLGAFEDERSKDDPIDPIDEPEEEFVREYGVVVYCEGESHQQELYERFRAEGLRVRVASI